MGVVGKILGVPYIVGAWGFGVRPLLLKLRARETGLPLLGVLGNSKIVRHDGIRWEHAPERFTGQCTSS